MTFADLIKDLIDTSKERIKTPITGAFLLAFVVYNWRSIFYIIFSEAKIECKLKVISENNLGWDTLYGPFGISVLYIIAVPYIMERLDDVLENPKQKRTIRSYDEKVSEYTGKIEVAKKELDLQDILSRSKEKSEFLNQINLLEIENKNLTDNNNLLKLQISKNMQQDNHELGKFLHYDNPVYDSAKFIISTLKDDELKYIKSLKVNQADSLENFDKSTLL